MYVLDGKTSVLIFGDGSTEVSNDEAFLAGRDALDGAVCELATDGV